ncbi:MAG: M48 family metalloprotease [Planctomycetes bacterium]|nr:M48 family metalloprotease [Planctomycetota bacterium]
MLLRVITALGTVFVAMMISAWLLGYRIGRRGEDALLFERVHAYRQRTTMWLTVLVLAIAAVPLWTGEVSRIGVGGVLGVMLAATFAGQLGLLIGANGLRARLKPQRPRLSREIAEWARLTIALTGFWLAILFAPYAIAAVHAPWRLPCAVGAVVVLLAWQRMHRVWVCWWLRAKPLEDADLREELETIRTRSRVPQTKLLVFGPEHGFVNAFALPGRRPLVLFTRGCLDELDRDELRGTLGHELAHLEEYEGGRHEKLERADSAIIVVACLLVPFASLFAHGVGVASVLWLFLVIVFLVWRGRGAKEHESDSDRRSVELCGDVDGLIRGLVKLHEKGFVPRRLSVETEQSATHPSLARRIADLRAAADALGVESRIEVVKAAGALLALRSRADPRDCVVLEDDRIIWIRLPADCETEQVDALIDLAEYSQSASYSSFVELRVVPRRGEPELRAVERGGRVHRFAIRSADLEQAQARLDAVDTQLAPASALIGPRRAVTCSLVAITMMLMLIAFIESNIGAGVLLVLLPLAFPAGRPSTRPWVAGFGLAGIFGAAEALLRNGPSSGLTVEGSIALVSVLVSCGFLVWRARPTEGNVLTAQLPRSARRIVALLLTSGVVVAALQLAYSPSDRTGLALHLWAANANGAATLLAAGFGAALWSGMLATRILIVGVCVLFVLKVACGSDLIARLLYSGPTTDAVPAAVLVDTDATIVRSMKLLGDEWGVRLSPNAERVQLSRGSGRFLVAGFDGSRIEISCEALAFVDDDSVLAVRIGERPRLDLLSLADIQKPRWSIDLPSIECGWDSELVAEAERWRLTVGLEYGPTEVVSGRVGFDEYSHVSLMDTDVRRTRVPIGGNSAFETSMPYDDVDQLHDIGSLYRSLMRGWLRIVDLAKIVGQERRVLGSVNCDVRLLEGGLDDPPLLFMENGARRTTWIVRGRSLEVLASGVSCDPDASAWNGKRVAMLDGDDLVVIDVKTRRGVRVVLATPSHDRAYSRMPLSRGPHVAITTWTLEGPLRVDLLSRIEIPNK